MPRVYQPLRRATRENVRALKQEFGDRVTLVDLPDAGHAPVPEQPDALVAAITGWLTGHRGAS